MPGEKYPNVLDIGCGYGRDCFSPEEYCKGEICPGELYEHRYDEPRTGGDTHHHISWILIAEEAG